ncbi:MAG: flagellar export chaperone FlgN [Desulfamplus sp.]|nr:flagellar export chaperone FlgN [Desulfamplus sp.]
MPIIYNSRGEVAMETLYYNIKNLFQKKLQIYSELALLMEAETGYIVKMDVNSLWAASSKKRELASDIEKLRNSIVFLLDDKHIDHGMDLRTFDIAHLISTLPLSSREKADLEMLKIAIEGKKNEIRQIASSNRRYIQEYLGVIDGVISTITGGAKPQSYVRRGLSVSSTPSSFYGTRYGRDAATTLISAHA